MNRLTACILLPTYNENENVQKIIPMIFDQQKRIESHTLQILVIDDESPDGTAATVRHLQKNYPQLYLISGKKQGLGEAYKRGIRYAGEQLRPQILFEMDADLQHDPALLPMMISLYNFGFTLIIGSRFLPGGQTVDFSMYRKFISLFGNLLIRLLTGLPRLRDFTSGFRCIDAALIQSCDLSGMSTRGYSFQTSLLVELMRRGANVLEIPILFMPRRYGESKLAFRDQFEFMINLVRIRFGQFYDFVRFVIIGVSGVVVNLGAFVLFNRLFQQPPVFSFLLSIESAIITNFLLNNLWNYKGRPFRDVVRRITKFHILALPAALTSLLVFSLLISKNAVSDLTAAGLGISSAVIINYFVQAFAGSSSIKN